ncbi:nuclear transport factor 2 family protein [Flavisphingomonas formosensis]|uniref:nuclear transport factor 2 family protein n=1 Tax=Flavisphingomonas formosensis TaxID=861534 RepID=UPI0012F9EE50|nr:nuclear transport factor 2 family protein [Sphingomonas formosensis]
MKQSLLALSCVAYRHAETEGAGDLDAILATMEDEPVYDFYPVARRFRGMDRTRRYYRHFIADVRPRIAGFEQHSEWIGPDGAVQEYSVTVIDPEADGGTRTYRILGILTFGDVLLSGERLYADEAFFRILIGPLWDELEPID